MMSFVLTRLHARYTKEDLGDDLVFRVAAPIMGGRGFPDADGKMSQEVEANASANNFQGRYAILHRWEGPMECAEPIRGRWGGPPTTQRRRTDVTAAMDLAAAPRGRVELAQLVRDDIPALGTEAAAPAASSEFDGLMSRGPVQVPEAHGCGGCTLGRTWSWECSSLSGFLLGVLLGMRRRRS
jgi:hypothetical protein